jgi:hypothetical protein
MKIQGFAGRRKNGNFKNGDMGGMGEVGKDFAIFL